MVRYAPTDGYFQKLECLQAELRKAIKEGVITGTSAVDAEKHIDKALLQKKEAVPDQKTLVEHLTWVFLDFYWVF